MSKIGFERVQESQAIPDHGRVKVTKMNHIIELVHVERPIDVLSDYRKLDKNHYVIVEPKIEIEVQERIDTVTGEKRFFVIDKATGEPVRVNKYNRNESRSQNIAGLKKTMKKIRNLINANFVGGQNELFLTLTYAFQDGKPMSCTRKASKDFDNFIKRFRRRYEDLEYLAVLEPQASTAWHWHILVKFTSWDKDENIFIDNNSIVYPLWGHGWTSTQRLDNVDNIGAYLGSYLTNVEIDYDNVENLLEKVYAAQRVVIEEKEVVGEDGEKTSKKYVKGGRMYLYPSGTNIYRKSKGIKPPEPQYMSYGCAKSLVGSRKPDFSRSIVITDTNAHGDKVRILNTISYENYNLKRGLVVSDEPCTEQQE
jgi:hypothetical protein